jgi:hypothetical protein
MAEEPRIAAYLLAADPNWLEESVRSYYDLIDHLVISYDETGTSWTGTAMPVDECLERLRAIDVDSKMRFAPGRYHRPGEHPLANETYQRSQALATAGENADWVIQLDTDEVLADPAEFRRSLLEAHRLGYTGLEYPARLLYQHVRDNLYLEQCRRLWTIAGHYPGPVAVRSGSRLTLARQGEVTLYRVDFRSTNTDPAHPADAPVHRVIRQSQAIMHYSMVRSDAHMKAKSRASGHAGDFDWDVLIAKWQWHRAHPFLAVARTPVQRGPGRRFLRLARIEGAPDAESRRRNGLTR